MKKFSALFLNMPSFLTFTALGLIFGYIIYALRIQRGGSKARPPSYPIVGSLFSFLRNRSRLLEWFTELLIEASSHTITIERLGGKTRVITAHPANVEYLLKTRFENYPKGDFTREVMHDLLGEGIFNVDGQTWKLQRRLASFEFSTRSLRDFIADTVHEEITARLLPLLRKSADAGSPLEIQDVLKRFAFNNICKVAFGTDPACHDISVLPSDFADAFDAATELIANRFVDPLPFVWKVKRMLNLGSEKRLREAIRIIHGFAEDVIRARKKEISLSGAPAHQDLLSRFLALHESTVGVADKASFDGFVRDIVISFVLAGRDTTSAALTWFFWLLSSHPRVERLLDLEVARVLAARTEAEKHFEGFFYEELKNMNYLHASLCETMRLYPPVPLDTKEALRDDVLPDGTPVSGGWRVSYHPYAMGRIENLWGSDCLEFKPERWMKADENGSAVFVGESPFKFSVFQAGPRVCLGKEMAFIQMKCIAASVIREFRLEAEASLNPKFVAMLTARMEGGLRVKVVKKSK